MSWRCKKPFRNKKKKRCLKKFYSWKNGSTRYGIIWYSQRDVMINDERNMLIYRNSVYTTRTILSGPIWHSCCAIGLYYAVELMDYGNPFLSRFLNYRTRITQNVEEMGTLLAFAIITAIIWFESVYPALAGNPFEIPGIEKRGVITNHEEMAGIWSDMHSKDSDSWRRAAVSADTYFPFLHWKRHETNILAFS